MLLLQPYPSHIRQHFSLSILLLLNKLLCVCVCVCVSIYKLELSNSFQKTVKIFKNYGSNIYTDDGDNCALKTQQTNEAYI